MVDFEEIKYTRLSKTELKRLPVKSWIHFFSKKGKFLRVLFLSYIDNILSVKFINGPFFKLKCCEKENPNRNYYVLKEHYEEIFKNKKVKKQTAKQKEKIIINKLDSIKKVTQSSKHIVIKTVIEKRAIKRIKSKPKKSLIKKKKPTNKKKMRTNKKKVIKKIRKKKNN